MTKVNKSSPGPFDRSELHLMAKIALNIMKSTCTMGIVLPAMTASTSAFRIKKYGTDLATITDDEEICAERPINILRPHSKGLFVAVTKSLANFCDLTEEFYRINPLTIYCAVTLAGIESLETMIDQYNNSSKPRKTKSLKSTL